MGEFDRWKYEIGAGELQARRDEAAQQVVDAWLIEGPNPKIHRKAKQRLAKDWPVLARAVERLAVLHEGAN